MSTLKGRMTYMFDVGNGIEISKRKQLRNKWKLIKAIARGDAVMYRMHLSEATFAVEDDGRHQYIIECAFKGPDTKPSLLGDRPPYGYGWSWPYSRGEYRQDNDGFDVGNGMVERNPPMFNYDMAVNGSWFRDGDNPGTSPSPSL